MKTVKAIIKLEVPDWQIGQDVSVYFSDTMVKHGKCELLKEQEAVKPDSEHHLFVCPVCKSVLRRNQKFCHECGKCIKWERR